MTNIRKVADLWWSLGVLVPVGLISLGYVLWGNSFAKIYLSISCVNFPIFIGEIVLGWCVTFLFLRFIVRPVSSWPMVLSVFLYLGWVLFKAASGYVLWGPLALRHAALFYYPFFFVAGFVFFNIDVFNKNGKLLFFALIVAVLAWGKYVPYWTLTLGCLGSIMIFSLKDKKWAVFLAIALFFAVPYVFLFKTARMMFVANTASLMFILIAVFALFKIKPILKMIILVVVLLAVSVGFHKYFVLGESGRTFPSFREISDHFNDTDKVVREREKSLRPQPRKSGLFTQQGKVKKMSGGGSVSLVYQTILPGNASANERQVSARPLSDVQDESLGNILFRLFIWRDMLEDWNVKKPLMGIDFGKPFLSPSLMVLHWDEDDWGRDGWIEPHNSFLNMCYRGGIVGVSLVVLIWAAWGWLVQLAFQRRSWIMILLAAVFLNWMVAANFLLIFEFAYTAIPFWTLAGMTGAYAFKR